ncbi:MAG: ribosome small subunit-dependent GTPase A [Cyanobacteriota bacterium]
MTEKYGTITKIHSNYYYVDFDNINWECMLRNKIKKEGKGPKVGDKVTIEALNYENNTCAISSILDRKNEIDKPNISNIDQLIIVSSSYAPDFNSLQLDKFIILSESHNIRPIICINKSDKIDDKLKEYITSIYKDTGYDIVYSSTFTKEGIDELKSFLLDKTTVLTGVSGSGKSSIINCIDPKLKLRIKEVSKNLGSGTHTTRHVSLQKFFYKDSFGFVADTPGFSFFEFNNIYSSELAWYYKEFVPFIPFCPLSGCLHWKEPNCNLKANIDIESTRYINYLNILIDILNLEKIQKSRSTKKEEFVKISTKANGKNIRVVKLGTQSREDSRRVSKQQLKSLERTDYFKDEDDYN